MKTPTTRPDQKAAADPEAGRKSDSTRLFDSPRSIWKFPLNPDASIEIPQGGQLLTGQAQRDEPQLWVMVDPSAPKETRRFKTFGTGHEITEDPGTYVATFQMRGGSLVFHVFESNAKDDARP